jgi:hypothetical protein
VRLAAETAAPASLPLFEKIYRFTPFSRHASPVIRGKSPLQLADCDVASLPMTTLWAGPSILWPMHIGIANHIPHLLI